jgi:hypothetical protein
LLLLLLLLLLPSLLPLRGYVKRRDEYLEEWVEARATMTASAESCTVNGSPHNRDAVLATG